MKKGLVYLMTAVMAVGLFTACGNKENTQDPGVTATATPDASGTNNEGTQTPVAIRVVLKDLDATKYVTIGDYKNIEVTMTGPEVDQEEWDLINAQVYNDFVTAESGGVLDRAVENGDLVNIDYSGKKDGVVFDGGTAAAQQLEIGSGSFIAGFEEGLVGVMPGETVDLNLTFPEVYHNADLAGQAVVFTVTVNFIYPTSESWNDDVVASAENSDFTTVEEMKQYVYDYLEEYNAYYYDINLENAVVEAFINQCEFKEVPEELVQSYRDDFTLTMSNEAAAYGMDVDSLCYYYYGVDLATFLDTYVTESAKQSLAFQAVANAENMNLSDADFDARLLELATQYGCTSIEQYIGANPKEGYRELFMLEDVVAFLVENATVKQPE